MEQGRRRRPAEFNLADGERSKFALAESGQYQRLVDQGPFPPEYFQAGNDFVTQTGHRFALARATVNSGGVQQRAAAGLSLLKTPSASKPMGS